MKTKQHIVLYTSILAIVFFITGKLIFSRLFALFEPTIKDIHFQITERPGQFPTSFLFAMLLALVIVSIALIWRIGSVDSTIRRTGVVTVISLFMIAGIFIRHQMVKNYFNGVVRPFLQEKNQLPFHYPIDPANFVYYMFAGCCIGCVVSFMLFRQKKYSG